MYGVRLDYEDKRNFFLEKLAEYAPADLVSSVPCKAGMFQWVKVDITKHPRYSAAASAELLDELWTFLVNEHNVLLLPAKLFSFRPDANLNFFRATVSTLLVQS